MQLSHINYAQQLQLENKSEKIVYHDCTCTVRSSDWTNLVFALVQHSSIENRLLISDLAFL